MRAVSPSRKQDAPPSPVNELFPILNVRDLTKSYATGAGRLTVLHNISFTLQQGATCSILGPSGSGKTTLLGLAAGLDLPTSGSVLLNGIALAEISGGRARPGAQ